MAHVEKFNKGAMGQLFAHYERRVDAEGNHRHYGNQDINLEKTHLNYNLAPDHGLTQIDFIRQRLSEVRVFKRADVKVMCDWVVTLPNPDDEELKENKNLKKLKTPDEIKKFFKETYKFLEKLYGKENVISSYVHLDETTPHMHFSFVPVVTDKKRGDLKVSAKEKLTRTHLKQFHPKLEKHLEKAFGFEVGILNQATKEGNKSIEELKKETAIEKVKELDKDIERKTEVINQANSQIKDILKLFRGDGRGDKLNSFKGHLNALEGDALKERMIELAKGKGLEFKEDNTPKHHQVELYLLLEILNQEMQEIQKKTIKAREDYIKDVQKAKNGLKKLESVQDDIESSLDTKKALKSEIDALEQNIGEYVEGLKEMDKNISLKAKEMDKLEEILETLRGQVRGEISTSPETFKEFLKANNQEWDFQKYLENKYSETFSFDHEEDEWDMEI